MHYTRKSNYNKPYLVEFLTLAKSENKFLASQLDQDIRKQLNQLIPSLKFNI